jgi:hypothetical protein
MIGFDDLIGETIKVIEVKGSDFSSETPDAISLTIEVDGELYVIAGNDWWSRICLMEAATYSKIAR